MRRLSAEEERLWARVVESVQPLSPRAAPAPPPGVAAPAPRSRPRPAPVRLDPAPSRRPPVPGETLDGSWDKRLARGAVAPDATVDLHGHNLATAYELLDRRLDEAISSGARLVLLITGKPPGPARPVVRGAIRAAVGDWLGASRHAGAIAAIRGAHPRHGGSGALYIVLRRRRT